VVVVREAVEPPAEHLPREQAAARLELADVARRVRVAPAVVADGLVAELGRLVQREADVGPRELAPALDLEHLVVGVEHEVAGGLLGALRVARRAALLQDGLDVAEVLERYDALGHLEAGLPLASHVRPTRRRP
jgi:hypothetical protein